jgi:ribosome modulation factor
MDEVSDVDVMEANGSGMDAYADSKTIHDNPYQHPDLRSAWHQGWMSAQLHDDEVEIRCYVPEADGRLLYTR